MEDDNNGNVWDNYIWFSEWQETPLPWNTCQLSSMQGVTEMSVGSQFITNCSNLSTEDLISINLSFSGTGAVCCLISSVIDLVLIICKAYQSVFQILFFYLMVATATRKLFLAASVEHHFEYTWKDKVCKWIAFIYSWTGIVVFVHTVGIMIYLFLLVRYLAKGNTIPQLLQSWCRRVTLETLYSFFCVADFCLRISTVFH